MKIIRKEMYGANLVYLGPGNADWQNRRDVVTLAGDYGPWTGYFGSVGSPRFFLQDKIDIAGLTTHMEKALIPSFVEVQQSPMYRAGGTAATEPDNFATELLMITTVPFDVPNWLAGPGSGEFHDYRLPTIFGVGDEASTMTLSADQCIYGRMRYLQNDIETFERIAQVKGESFFGNPTATMSDDLYLTRIITWTGTLLAGATFTVPDVEFLLHTEHKELNDLAQIMELRRSYLLQQTIA